MSPRDATATPAAATAAAAVENASLLGMKQELRELRGMLESQLSSLAWNDLGRRKPLSARMLRELSRLGIDADVAGAIVADLPEHISPEQARYLPLGLLSRKLPVNAHDFLDDGGVVALLGATGVGKTTTLAKLAARYVMRHGLKGVALVTTDDFRIGAEEQLFHYGRLLGVPVYSAGEPAALCALMERLADQRLVLIDTPGMACRDARVAALMHGLRETRTPVRNTLVLAANAQAAALDEALRAYAPFAPAGCILTKLDEAPTLGGALSALIRHRLPVDYSTDGQRVPEDIARADAHRLVCRAVKANTPAPPLDDFALAERFGRVAVAFA
ncbi:flagellar biosynthetic protein FlhF [Mizugakiibacter sediminis]|uniref:Flagellar biosynthesis protein FlhF n=2 Tax=Mizugakiibacter sediminis TaxID=1475481 RepID=A0A0K8QQV5_9GAMM|nr:flagellar biosynthetic protein FlhF [Mizugakiibacter sediminis]